MGGRDDERGIEEAVEAVFDEVAAEERRAWRRYAARAFGGRE